VGLCRVGMSTLNKRAEVCWRAARRDDVWPRWVQMRKDRCR
jgi:hypothetical protein